jgi:2-keto-4-pentenoate hydratase
MSNKVVEAAGISNAFRAARREARALSEFPGILPASLDDAYAVQELSIDQWGDRVAGWKIGLIPPPLRAKFGAERLAGPIFGRRLQNYRPGIMGKAAFVEGGFGAIEAEFVLRLGADIPDDAGVANDEGLTRYIAAMHIGVELAGSPLETINALGPTAVICDFGNNSGLIVGPEIPGWRDRALLSLSVRMIIDGEVVGEGSAANVPEGPFGALRFLIENCRARRRPLRAGMFVSTGAVTGVHQVKAGARATADFGKAGRIEILVEKAMPLVVSPLPPGEG